MDASRKSRLMYSIVQNYFKDWEKSYWELDWVTTGDFGEFAELFNIKPKAGATPARTLYERLQKYHNKYDKKNQICWTPTTKEVHESAKNMFSELYEGLD